MLLHLTEAVLVFEDLVGRLSDLGLALEDRRELRPALRLQVEAVERANRGLVLGVDLHHAPVAHDGVVDVLELDLEDLRGAEPELHEALGRLGELVELGVVERGDLRPAVHDHREPLEVLERRLVAVVERERARVRVERGRVVLERVLVEARDAMEEVDLRERRRSRGGPGPRGR